MIRSAGVSFVEAVLLLFASLVAVAAYRRTAPPEPRALAVLVVAAVLVVFWLLEHVGAVRLGRW